MTGETDVNYYMSMPKDVLVAYARKVKAALPHEDVIVSGRKADIAHALVIAIQHNPE
jgi:hypothetical protein